MNDDLLNSVINAEESNLRKGNSRAVRGEIIILAVFLSCAVLLVAGGVYLHRSLNKLSAAGTEVLSGISENEAGEIVHRSGKLLDEDFTGRFWPRLLASGQAGIEDYLLRFFVSPDYLASQPEDDSFISDLYYVMTGRQPAAEEKAQAASLINDSRSRLALINYLLENLGYAGRLDIPAVPTRLRTFYLAGDRPQSGAEIVGKALFAAEARLTGKQARLKLYVDGRIRASYPVEVPEPEVLNAYSLEWDARKEIPGSKDLTMLLLTNDGRGRWQEIGTYAVPEVKMLETGKQVSENLVILDGQANTLWYELPAADSDALLNILPSETNMSVDLYDLYNQHLAMNSSHGKLPMAVRYRPPADITEEPVYYIRVSPANDSASGEMLAFSLLPSFAVAIENASPGEWVPVMAADEGKLQIIDGSGQLVWRDSSGFELFDATARLTDIELGAEGLDLGFVPEFDREEQLYGLVADEGTEQLRLSARAMEGTAADISIRNLTENGPVSGLDISSEILLEVSVNRLLLDVTGYDGSQRTYEINVLRPPHSGRFDFTLQLFPDSYQSWLWLLHVQRPAYQFGAIDTGIDWTEFVDAQSTRDRSLVDAATVPASWVKPGSQVYDGVSWKAAARPVVAHYGDPRNFLNQSDIFQFERLTFDPQIHNRTGIEAMLQDTFMQPGNPENIDYAVLLLDAAREADISPFFLAAKIIQEMGRQGQSPLAFGQLAGYEGAYNFYNINSTPNPEIPDGARINGARFALYGLNPDEGELGPEEKAWLLPWNTPERAITGGAIWIAQKYVQIGQDTIYLQKFDLIGVNGLYNHQYAQNIQMAWAEGLRTYRAYSDLDLLDRPFAFRIPVYENMPQELATLP